MRDYTGSTAAELLQDEHFLNYCSRKNNEAVVFWEAYLRQNPSLQAEADHALKLYHLLSITVPAAEKEAALDKLKTAMGESNNAPVVVLDRSRIKKMLLIVAAAVVTGLVIMTVRFYNPTPKKLQDIVADYSQVHFDNPLYSEATERKTITLPDGSQVILNYGSSIKLDKDYNKNVRWLQLEGEAFFSVKPDAAKPFVVLTSKTATTALGTSFKVRNFSGETLSNVMLATGKVSVESLKTTENTIPKLMLLPGEAAAIKPDQQLQKSGFNIADLEDWRNTRISFNNASMDEIVEKLEFYYAVHVRVTNKPAKPIAFTGKFAGNSINEVLEAIAFTNKFAYTQKNNTVSIQFQ